jgi:hypothetical protein
MARIRCLNRIGAIDIGRLNKVAQRRDRARAIRLTQPLGCDFDRSWSDRFGVYVHDFTGRWKRSPNLNSVVRHYTSGPRQPRESSKKKTTCRRSSAGRASRIDTRDSCIIDWINAFPIISEYRLIDTAT